MLIFTKLQRHEVACQNKSIDNNVLQIETGIICKNHSFE